MYTQLPDDAVSYRISTGHLPPVDEVEALMRQAYARYRDLDEGKVADDIPARAKVSPALFGNCLAGVNGGTFAIGGATHEFSIQSVSKPFIVALVCEAIGSEEARGRIGVNATGRPCTSAMAVEVTR